MAVASDSPVKIMSSPPVTDAMEAKAASDSAAASDSSSPEPPDHVDRSLSLPNDSDLQASSALRTEEYRQLFRLPADEVLVQDFNCALQESILFQGHMYLFEHYICFYSNIFGFETKKIIPFNEVTSVRRAKTAGIFPNAVEIAAGGRKHFFASFLSRDEAFKLIVSGWSQQSNGTREIMDQQELKSGISSQSNEVVTNVRLQDSEGTEPGGDERNLETSEIEDSGDHLNVVDDSERSNTLDTEDVLLVQERQVNVKEDSSNSLSTTYWEQETMDAPGIPQCYSKVAESKFPIKVEEFFNLFFSDDAIDFAECFHERCGDKEFSCSKWRPHDEFGHVRELSFQHPIKVYFGAKFGGCKEQQKFRVYRNSHLVIESSQEVMDVPYADYFRVEGLWDVQRVINKSKESCILRVYVNVAFSKKTMWKGKIEQSTVEECREAYSAWIELAHQLLKQMSVAKLDGVTTNSIQNGKVDRCAEGAGGTTGTLHESSKQASRVSILSKPQKADQHTDNSLPINGFEATMIISLFEAMMRKCSSFLRNPGNLRLLLVIIFTAILLLMQLSIVVLLSRPQQVYVIPQAMDMREGQRSGDVVGWVEKRLHLLKDEMLVVEVQLERMRHEQVLLRAQLDDLERLRKKR